ncbi:MAG: thioredoxin fold domain-containing protein [Bacteroidetes bacterium]|nr:thioredoxin fold domain-containing protein [Bacteroidota bacterium]
MRTTLLTLAMMVVGNLAFGQAASINWISLEEAVAAQQKEPRKIMMDVYTQWCGPCKMMMANTFTNANVIDYVNANYYAVKFDAESPDPVTFQGTEFTNPDYNPSARGRNGVHQLSRAMKVNAYPTIVYLDEEANVIAPISGYKQPSQMELYLKFFNEAYQPGVDQTAWEEYRDNFAYTWR